MRTRLLAAILALAALPLYAAIRPTLDEPRAGAVLRGGSTATISWSATGLPADAEEWEAFLSVDGGAFYAYRVTPHLELDQQRFTFEVPNVATRNARLLLRVGDEHEEHELEFPATFTIEENPLLALAESPKEIDEEERGEPARRGDPGVIQWIEGDRTGRHLLVRSAAQHGRGLRESLRVIETLETAEASSPLPLASPRGNSLRAFVATRSGHARTVAVRRDGRDVLLSCRRLNI
ncbi:MAG TPA: hypothetical protein VHW00_23770 [Thermoanaerobaculia bacterium]|nr:hypothetical protein [Thermoanaerobaculia bacterium]